MRSIHPVCRLASLSLGRLALVFLSLIALTPLTAAAAEPKPSPHKFIPAKGLIAFVEFDGLDAHAEAWKATSAYGVLVKTPAGAMITQVTTQVMNELFKSVPDLKLIGADLIALHEHLMQEGFVAAMSDDGTGASAGIIVVNGAGAKPMRERFDRVLLLTFGSGANGKLPSPVRFRGRDVYYDPIDSPKQPENPPVELAPPPDGVAEPMAPKSPTSWWFYEGDDLVLVEGPDDTAAALVDPAKKGAPGAGQMGRLSMVFDTIEGKQPNVETHAAYLAAVTEGKTIKGFEPDGLFFIDPGNNKGVFTQLFGGTGTLARLGARSGLLPYAGVDLPAPPPAPYATTGLLPPMLASDTEAATPATGSFGLPGPTALSNAEATVPTLAPQDLPPVSSDPKAEVKTTKRTTAGPAGSVKPAPSEEHDPVDIAKPQLDPAQVLGLDGIKRIVGRWGFEGKALVTGVRIEAPAPRTGVVAWMEQPAFRKDHLPPIPRGTGVFAVNSFDPGAGYQKIVDGLKALEPGVGGEIDQVEKIIRDTTGLRLREDLLKHLGPTWSLLRLPSVDRMRGAEAEVDPTAYALLASVDDPEALGKVLDSVAARFNQYLRDQDKGRDKGDRGEVGNETDPPILALERLPAPDRGYQLKSPARLVPWLDDEVRPTILVGKSFVACASNLERAREALASEAPGVAPWTSSGELAAAFACLPERLTFLAVGDHRDSPWPDALAHFPSTVQVLSAFLGIDSDPGGAGTTEMLAVLGIPRPGGFRVRIAAARIPSADQIRPYLFPSVLAATVDDRGFRIIMREALPLACFGNKATVKSSMKWSSDNGFSNNIKLMLGLFR